MDGDTSRVEAGESLAKRITDSPLVGDDSLEELFTDTKSVALLSDGDHLTVTRVEQHRGIDEVRSSEDVVQRWVAHCIVSRT